MGFRDTLAALFGDTRLPPARLDNLVAISTASITLQTSLDLKHSSRAGLCFKPVESSQYAAAKTEIDELLRLSCRETGTTYMLATDEYHFTWVILEDPDFEDLVASIHMVSQTLFDRGFGTYLLCAVYRFENEKPVYLIYPFKQGRYYPFVPAAAATTRDPASEFRIHALLEKELPMESDQEKWYPLWGIPL
jgi:hypothetical protein